MYISMILNDLDHIYDHKIDETNKYILIYVFNMRINLHELEIKTQQVLYLELI